jgi:hypothetical protein
MKKSSNPTHATSAPPVASRRRAKPRGQPHACNARSDVRSPPFAARRSQPVVRGRSAQCCGRRARSGFVMPGTAVLPMGDGAPRVVHGRLAAVSARSCASTKRCFLICGRRLRRGAPGASPSVVGRAASRANLYVNGATAGNSAGQRLFRPPRSSERLHTSWSRPGATAVGRCVERQQQSTQSPFARASVSSPPPHAGDQ